MNSYHKNIVWYEFVSQLGILVPVEQVSTICPTGSPGGVFLFRGWGIAPMFDELWSEIADAPGEIFDVIEYKEEWEKDEKFNVESYINSNYDYWCRFLWSFKVVG